PISNTGVVVYSQGGTGGKGGDTSDGSADGGNGGKGGDGGTITVTNNVALSVTGGTSAFGIVAQSAGGQGGAGGKNKSDVAGDGGSGVAGGAGGIITITNKAAITTDGGIPLTAQSIGGFGGNGGSGGGAFGGSGGSGGFGGDAGAVTIANSGALSVGNSSRVNCTVGDSKAKPPIAAITTNCNAAGSHAIYAQSVGGGGGNAGYTAGLVALGASGGKAGTGDTVIVTNTSASTIQLFGYSGVGIFAQSTGGAGGSGGMAHSASVVAVSVGGSGGDGGDGGQVQVTNAATICTGSTGTGNGCVAISGKSATTSIESAGGAYGIFA
ncbi:unnamed protein product, partial [Phaeothamnion confervicola]